MSVREEREELRKREGVKKREVCGVQTNLTENMAEKSQKVKTLPVSVRKDIQQKNIARQLAGLPEIKVKVRRCISCGGLFESSGNRTCGCTSRSASTIGGREII